MSLALRGDASIDDFRAASPVGAGSGSRRGLAMVREAGSGPPLLTWKSLSLRGIDVALAPGARPRMTIAETALSDFFARIVLDEEGRLNLQEVARPGDAARAGGGGRRVVAGLRAGHASASERRRRRGAPGGVRAGGDRRHGADRASSTAGSRSTTASSSRTTAPT